jgi:hypothetical protein
MQTGWWRWATHSPPSSYLSRILWLYDHRGGAGGGIAGGADRLPDSENLRLESEAVHTREWTIYWCHHCGWIQGEEERDLACAQCGEGREWIEEIQVVESGAGKSEAK